MKLFPKRKPTIGNFIFAILCITYLGYKYFIKDNAQNQEPIAVYQLGFSTLYADVQQLEAIIYYPIQDDPEYWKTRLLLQGRMELIKACEDFLLNIRSTVSTHDVVPADRGPQELSHMDELNKLTLLFEFECHTEFITQQPLTTSP